MAELERALAALAGEIEFPTAPDLRPRVRERLERRRLARPFALAVALLVVAFGIAMAVPPARSAILRFFHIGAVTVERVQRLPAARERPLATGLGPARTLDQAQVRSGVTLILRTWGPSASGSRAASTSSTGRPGRAREVRSSRASRETCSSGPKTAARSASRATSVRNRCWNSPEISPGKGTTERPLRPNKR